jgi:hypothetical protein
MSESSWTGDSVFPHPNPGPHAVSAEKCIFSVRGCLHVYESGYNSAYDFLHDLHARQINSPSDSYYKGLRAHFIKKTITNSLPDTFGSKSYTESYVEFVRKSARVNGPLPCVLGSGKKYDILSYSNGFLLRFPLFSKKITTTLL